MPMTDTIEMAAEAAPAPDGVSEATQTDLARWQAAIDEASRRRCELTEEATGLRAERQQLALAVLLKEANAAEALKKVEKRLGEIEQELPRLELAATAAADRLAETETRARDEVS